jgi:hypothetical protein
MTLVVSLTYLEPKSRTADNEMIRGLMLAPALTLPYIPLQRSNRDAQLSCRLTLADFSGAKAWQNGGKTLPKAWAVV